MRGVWVSLICINYAFPDGIRSARLPLAHPFQTDKHSKTLTNEIIQLDKFTGLIFYAGFAFVQFTAGLVLSLAFIAMVGGILPTLIAPLLLILVLFYLDLILAGYPLRRYRVVAKFYFPVYMFFNIITLTFLGRKGLQVIFSNTNKFKAAVFLVAFIASSFFLSFFSLYKVLHIPLPLNGRQFTATHLNPGVLFAEPLYLDKIDPHENIRWFAIESDVLEGKFMKIFVNYRVAYDDTIQEAEAKSFSSIVQIKIDGEISQNIDWIAHKRLYANQEGIMAMIDIQGLDQGKHLVELTINNAYYQRAPKIKVPFWKDAK